MKLVLLVGLLACATPGLLSVDAARNSKLESIKNSLAADVEACTISQTHARITYQGEIIGVVKDGLLQGNTSVAGTKVGRVSEWNGKKLWTKKYMGEQHAYVRAKPTTRECEADYTLVCEGSYAYLRVDDDCKDGPTPMSLTPTLLEQLSYIGLTPMSRQTVLHKPGEQLDVFIPNFDDQITMTSLNSEVKVGLEA